MKGASWAFDLLGSIASTLALCSFIQRAWSIGLIEALAAVLERYRAIVKPIHDLAQEILFALPFNLVLPIWYGEAVVLSAVGAAGTVRFLIADAFPGQRNRHPLFWLVFGLAFAVGFALLTITLLGAWVLATAIPSLILQRVGMGFHDSEEERAKTTAFALQLSLGLVGTVVFFTLNAFGG